MKRLILTLALSAMIPGLSACGSQTLGASAPAASSAASQAGATRFLALSAEQQAQVAAELADINLVDWVKQNQSATAEAKASSFNTLLSQHPELAAAISAQLQRGAGGPGGMGGPPPGGMGPGGLPPNLEDIRAKYPELAAALEAMQSLSPEARRTQMDALFTEHPEWREAMMPPGGMGPGGAGEPGGFGPPPGGMPPSGMPAPSASPQS